MSEFWMPKREMTKKEYHEYLKTEQWRNRSKEQIDKIGKCQICACSDKNRLQCHHNSYDSIGHEPDEDLLVVCGACHSLVHHRFPSIEENVESQEKVEASLEAMKQIQSG